MRSNRSYGFSLMFSVLAAITACNSTDSSNDTSGATGGSAGASNAGSSGASGTAGGGGTAAVGGTAGSSGASGSAGSSGSSGSASAWTALPLLDDNTDPQNVISHAGEDRVTSIYFSALDKGLVATEGANGTVSDGGMLYHASQHKLEGVALSGKHASGSGLEVAFLGIFPTSNGFVVGLDTSETTALSTDGGATFSVVVPNIPYGLTAEVVLLEGTDHKWTYVGDTGVISEATEAPSPTTQWTEIWAPEGAPPTPDPVPADQCHASPASPNSPNAPQFVYVSPDRQFVAYPAVGEYRICISHDGGRSFFPKVLPAPPEGAGPLGPTGITFISPQIGLAYDGYDLKTDGSFIYRTVDGGETWTLASLPAAVTQEYTSIRYVFFAPDATHGFAVGYTGNNPLLMRTSDAGATWTVAPGQSSLAAAMTSLNAFKLYTGFAFDATHIWVGGEHGSVYASDTGGE